MTQTSNEWFINSEFMINFILIYILILIIGGIIIYLLIKNMEVEQ